MGISLSKGSKINLSKEFGAGTGEGGLSELTIGLGWDTNKYDGVDDFDLDASIFILGADGKVTGEKDFVYYNNSTGANGGIIHSGDNRTGDGDGDDETIEVNLGVIPSTVDKIAFTVTIHDADTRNQNFGQVSNAYVRILNKATGEEIVRYDLEEDFSTETAIVVAELYNKSGDWRFSAVGSGYAGGLGALATSFGLEVN